MLQIGGLIDTFGFLSLHYIKQSKNLDFQQIIIIITVTLINTFLDATATTFSN